VIKNAIVITKDLLISHMSHLKSNGGEQKLKRKKPEKHKLLLMLKLKLLDSRQLMILPLWRLS